MIFNALDQRPLSQTEWKMTFYNDHIEGDNSAPRIHQPDTQNFLIVLVQV